MAAPAQAEMAGSATRFANQHGVLRHLTIMECVALTGMSRSTIYRALTRGDLKAVKSGDRSLVPVANLHAFIAALPPALFGKEAMHARRRAR